jgi:phage shock protein PspC (stress-responsive transcriptional regulator)
MTETAPPTPPPAVPPRPRLERPRDGRLLTGAAAGLARHLRVDVAVVRIAFVVVTLFGGAGFVAYIAAALLIPAEGEERPRLTSLKPSRSAQVALGAAFLALGAAVALGATDVLGLDTALGVLVVAWGVILVAGAFAGGARWLILPALLLFAVAGAFRAAHVHLHGGWGDRTVAVTSAGDLHSRYDLAGGRLTLDLSGVHFPAGRATHVAARVGLGELDVRLPSGVTVRGSARTGAGDLVVFGRRSDGLGVSRTSFAAGAGPATVVLDTDVGMGSLRVGEGTGE